MLSILYNKEKRNYVTAPVKPKLLTDNPGKKVALSQDHYAVCFEETIILEASDLQLRDEGNNILFLLDTWMIKSYRTSPPLLTPLYGFPKFISSGDTIQE